MISLLAVKGMQRGSFISRRKFRWIAGSASIAASVLVFGVILAGSYIDSKKHDPLQLLSIDPSSGRIEVAADQENNPAYNVLAKFRIINYAAEPLVIEEVTSSCSCSSPSLNTSVVEPGNEAILAVRVYPAKSRSKTFTLNLLMKGAVQNAIEIPCVIVSK